MWKTEPSLTPRSRSVICGLEGGRGKNACICVSMKKQGRMTQVISCNHSSSQQENWNSELPGCTEVLRLPQVSLEIQQPGWKKHPHSFEEIKFQGRTPMVASGRGILDALQRETRLHLGSQASRASEGLTVPYPQHGMHVLLWQTRLKAYKLLSERLSDLTIDTNHKDGKQHLKFSPEAHTKHKHWRRLDGKKIFLGHWVYLESGCGTRQVQVKTELGEISCHLDLNALVLSKKLWESGYFVWADQWQVPHHAKFHGVPAASSSRHWNSAISLLAYNTGPIQL